MKKRRRRKINGSGSMRGELNACGDGVDVVCVVVCVGVGRHGMRMAT